VIRFSRFPEPSAFDTRCRRRGRDWLVGRGSQELPDYWSEFRHDLREGFGRLCAYCAMHIPAGLEQVDHYVGIRENPALAYEWDNFRSSQAIVNQRKGFRRAGEPHVLDPFEVEDGWFELLLPSLQLVLTDQVPPETRERAEFTLRRLRLRDNEQIIRQRREWLALYEEGKLSIQGLEEMAPLIARAVKKRDCVPGT